MRAKDETCVSGCRSRAVNKNDRSVIQLTHLRSHSEISEATASVLASEHLRYGGCHGETKTVEQQRFKGRTRPPRPRCSHPTLSDRTLFLPRAATARSWLSPVGVFSVPAQGATGERVAGAAGRRATRASAVCVRLTRPGSAGAAWSVAREVGLLVPTHFGRLA